MALSGPANATFIAHARTDIPALLAYIADLARELSAFQHAAGAH